MQYLFVPKVFEKREYFKREKIVDWQTYVT